MELSEIEKQERAEEVVESKVYGMLLIMSFMFFVMGAALGWAVGKGKAVDHSGARFYVESTPPIESTR